MNNNRIKAISQQLDFAKTDTICFFSPFPEDLRKLQEKEWLPVINWVNSLGCEFKISQELVVREISSGTKDFLEKHLEAMSDEKLYAFCAVSGACRSVILALAVSKGFLTPQKAFDLAMLEESYQNKIWQEDEDALMSRLGRRQSVLDAAEKLKGI